MNFETGDVYHIYNQGNDKARIFYSRENYFLFLKKIEEHILPHADVLSWCLMPNHFHLMVYVHTREIEIPQTEVGLSSSEGFTQSKPFTKTPLTPINERNLNSSIGILLSSYTRTVNLHVSRSGPLFSEHTHAECLTNKSLQKPSFLYTPHDTLNHQHYSEKEYPKVCFDYIHNNPVKSGLVKHAEDWEFSSYPEYSGVRNGKLINRKRAEEFGLI